MKTAMLSTLAVAAFALVPAGSAAAAGPDAFTPIVQSAVARPSPVKGSDGRYHLVYEVQALNASSLPWNVRSIAIRAAGPHGRTLARWSGARVAKVMVTIADHKPARRLAPGQGALLFLTFSVASRNHLPAALEQRLVLRNATRPVQGPPAVTETAGRVRIARRAPVVLGPPLTGARWLAADGCCTAVRHIRAVQPYGGRLRGEQRFAIDWERLDDQGRLFTGDKRRLQHWFGYGAPVLAVADATVVHAVNRLPDQVPGALPQGLSLLEADGNGVILRLDDGRFVFYGHMIPGSVSVKAGDRVRRGQQIGLVGNSGNSSAPHLHLHVMDRNAILGANGLPYVFDGFDITGRVASTAAFDKAEATGQPARMRPVRTGPRRDELPLDQVLVTWP
jgi:murein DD-endopeptidase MepM/ murein hydrolase activator NlpD